MKEQFLQFVLRWFVNSLGLWIAAELFSGSIQYDNDLVVILLAGIVLSIINTILKPVIIILSLPAIIFTLGIFIVFINGLMVWLAGVFVPGFEVQSYGVAILAGMIIGLVNYAITATLDHEGLDG